MRPTLSPFLSRCLALALVALVLLVIFFGLVAPWLDAYGEARATEERLTAALARANAAERDPAALEAELRRLTARRAAGTGYLRSSNEPLATAELQERIKSAVEAEHGKLRSTQILAPRDDGKFRRVAVRGEIMVDMEGLQRVLYTLEGEAPFLFLDNVEIRAIAGAARAGTAPGLEVRFDLYGYLRRPV